MDEFEAIRLADLDGLYHDKAAERMKVSRQTFGRIIGAARHKVAEALVKGLVLRIEGGEKQMAEKRIFTCMKCKHAWDVPFGTGRPIKCPACNDAAICRADGQRGRRRLGEACPRGRS
jgi:transposase-like protein